MATARELLRQGRTDELWQRYLGFLDLSLEEAMTIQKRKVLEHVAWLAPCELGRKIIGPHVPKTVDELRERVPLTTYADYSPYLLERKADALPEEPLDWMRTSGRGGEYSAKWSPVFRDAWEDIGHRSAGAIVVMAAARFKGDFRVHARDKLPFTWAPPPFSLGLMGKSLLEELPLVAMPAEDAAASMDFQQRIGTALQMGMREGIDHFFGLASVLVKIGEQFAQNSSRRRHSSGGLPHPKALWRILKGLARSKLAGRPMYPKDLWNVKGVAAGGTDTSVFADRIHKYWNEAHGIDLPQFTVKGRWDDVIDLAGFTRLTERTIWYAIEGSGIPYEEWMCRKEMENEDPVLWLWLEPKDHTAQVTEVQRAIHESLKQLDSDYRDLETMLGYHLLRVTLLSPGTFQRYMLNRQAAGAEPAHFKPRHFVHSDEVLNLVLQMDAEGRQG